MLDDEKKRNLFSLFILVFLMHLEVKNAVSEKNKKRRQPIKKEKE